MASTKSITLALLLAVFCCCVLAEEEGIDIIRGRVLEANLNVTKIELKINEEANQYEYELNVNSINISFEFTSMVSDLKDRIKGIAQEAQGAGKDVTECIRVNDDQFFNLENETSYSFFDCNEDDVANIKGVTDGAVKSIPDLYSIEDEMVANYLDCSDNLCKAQIVYSAGIQVDKVLLIAQHAAELAHLDFLLVVGGSNCAANVNRSGAAQANLAYESFIACVNAAGSKPDPTTAPPPPTMEGFYYE